MNSKTIAIAILMTGLFFAIFVVAIVGQNPAKDIAQKNNVQEIDGKQIIDLSAKGGYSPRVTIAKAGMETVLRVQTKNTYDCSSAIVIPEINYRSRLTPSGVTEIKIPAQAVGKNIRGFCAMGMYNFNIQFN